MQTNMKHSSRSLMLALAFAVGSATPLLAEKPQQSDFQALRFYLDQDNEAAASAELRRLRMQFPNWSAPADLSDLRNGAGPDSIDQIYRLIERGDFDDARALISETDRAFADWSPPADLLALLSLSEAQQQFTAAVAAQQAATAIGIARGIPALLSCELVNNAWELAEMHLVLGDTARALSIYQSIIGSCSSPEIAISTLEKGDAIASLSELEALSDLAQANVPDIAPQVRSVENHLRAGRQVPPRWQDDESVIAIEAPDAPDSAAQTPAVRAPDSPRPAPRPAASPGPRAPQAPAQPGAGLGAVQAAAQRGAWAECLALSTEATGIEMIYQRGWCAYNAERPMEAVSAFQAAAQRGGNATMRRDATFGWMLALLKLNMTEQAAQLAVTVDLTHAQRVEIEGQILDQRGLRAFEQRDYRRAIAFFDAHAQLTGSMRRDLGLLKGYALLNSGNRAAARDLFLHLHRQLATSETRRAMRAVE